MNKEQILAIIQGGHTTDGDLADALLAELAKVQEPVAWNQAGNPLYLHPEPSVPEWQPIETAPMLKTVLLAVEFDGPGDWRIKCGSFYSNEWHLLDLVSLKSVQTNIGTVVISRKNPLLFWRAK